MVDRLLEIVGYWFVADVERARCMRLGGHVWELRPSQWLWLRLPGRLRCWRCWTIPRTDTEFAEGQMAPRYTREKRLMSSELPE